MEYEQVINMLDNTSNQPSKFRTKNWVEINDDSCGMCSTGIKKKFPSSVLKTSLCKYSDAYIVVKGTISVEAVAEGGGNNEEVIFKTCALFTDCISDINNTQIDNDKDIHVVMSMYNLIEYSDNYSKTSRGLWNSYKDESALADGVIACYFLLII